MLDVNTMETGLTSPLHTKIQPHPSSCGRNDLIKTPSTTSDTQVERQALGYIVLCMSHESDAVRRLAYGTIAQIFEAIEVVAPKGETEKGGGKDKKEKNGYGESGYNKDNKEKKQCKNNSEFPEQMQVFARGRGGSWGPWG